MAPKKEPSQACECRLSFQTSYDQAHRIDLGVAKKKVSLAEWLRQAAETQLKRQRL